MDIRAVVKKINQHYDNCIALHAKGDISGLTDELFALDSTVYENLGYNIGSALTDKGYSVSIRAPYTIGDSLLDTRALKAFSEGKLKSFKPTAFLNGTLDHKTGKVTGGFSKIRFVMNYTKSMFDGRMSADNLTAILAHELGHAWDLFVTMGVTLPTSAMCAGIYEFFGTHSDPIEQRDFARVTLNSVNPSMDVAVDKDDLVMLVTSTVPVAFEEFTGVKFNPVEVGELLADQFVSKWQLESSFAQAVIKMYESNNLLARAGMSGRWRGVLGFTLSMLFMPWKVLTNQPWALFTPKLSLVAGGTFLGVNLVLYTLVGVVTLAIKGMIEPYGTHPTPKHRLEAIRRNLILRLKETTDPVEKEAILADMDMLTKHLDELKTWVNPHKEFFTTIAKYLTGKKAAENKLEGIASRAANPLFELTARLESF